jgi:hypothetical protein
MIGAGRVKFGAEEYNKDIYKFLGGAVSQTVIQRLPTTAAWVLSQARLLGIYGGQSGILVGVSLNTSGFLSILVVIPPSAPYSLISPSLDTLLNN